jgi:hypothetical protein
MFVKHKILLLEIYILKKPATITHKDEGENKKLNLSKLFSPI